MKEKITAREALDAALLLTDFLLQRDADASRYSLSRDIETLLEELFTLNGYPSAE